MKLLLILLVASTLCVRPTAAAGQVEFEAWVGLYDEDLLSWLENENLMSTLCDLDSGSPEALTCVQERLRPLVRNWPVFSTPDAAAPALGWITLVAVPGWGLDAFWTAVETPDAPVHFVPDVYDRDWGYGPYYHQSILERRGDWFLLPAVPFSTSVWIHRPAPRLQSVLSVSSGEIVEISGEGWMVLSASGDGFEARPEQRADLWCGIEPEPPAVEPYESRFFSAAELRNARGAYIMRPKYTRGC